MARYRIVHDHREGTLAFKVQRRSLWIFWKTVGWTATREQAEQCAQNDASWSTARPTTVWEGDIKP